MQQLSASINALRKYSIETDTIVIVDELPIVLYGLSLLTFIKFNFPSSPTEAISDDCETTAVHGALDPL